MRTERVSATDGADDVDAPSGRGIEHRAAPGTDRLQLALRTDAPALALEVVEQTPAELRNQTQPSSLQRIEQILAQVATPLTQRQLRDAARMRASHVTDILAQLLAAGRVSRSSDDYRLKS